jgi:dTDP-4-dehydrorhamnose 3,5-epimerase-like enzyme
MNSKEAGVELEDANGVRLVRLNTYNDARGKLRAGEFPGELPFEPKRFFLVSEVPSDIVRGQHAHIECEQFLIAVRGSVRVRTTSMGIVREHWLKDPSVGLFLPRMVWGEQDCYSADCVLLVLASQEYDSSDYLRDFQEFLEAESAYGSASS